MKRHFMNVALMVALLVPFLAQPLPAQAKLDLKSGESISIDDDIFEDDVIIAGAIIGGKMTVMGDAIIVGSNLNINGLYEDDLNIAGGSVNVAGLVRDNLRMAGGDVKTSAAVDGNLYMAGGQMIVEEDAVVNGDLYMAGGMLVINGTINGDAHVTGGQLLVNGEVKGNIFAEVEEINVADKAVIGGDLEYSSNKEIAQLKDGLVQGKVVYDQIKQNAGAIGGVTGALGAGAGIIGWFTNFVLGLVMLFVVGFVLVLLLPKFSNRVTHKYSKSIWWSLLYGVIALIVTPILSIVIMFTIVGLPLGMIAFVSYFVTIYLAKVYAGLTLGSVILGRTKTDWLSYVLALALGVFVMEIIVAVPFVGGFLNLVLVAVGFGAIVRAFMTDTDRKTIAKKKK